MSVLKKFDNVVTALETVSVDNLIKEFVRSRLLDKELFQKTTQCVKYEENKWEVQSAFKSAQKLKFKCYNCGKVGHRKCECRFKRKEMWHQASEEIGCTSIEEVEKLWYFCCFWSKLWTGI